jgi:hypothetical protein
VQFAEGNLDIAEKYVAAAWQLGQHGEVGDHLGQIYEKRGEKEKAVHTYALAMNGLRPVPETRGRLAKLLGGDDKVDASVAQYRDELQRLRTFALGKQHQAAGNADFFVLVAPGNGHPVVDGVKLISGDDKLRSLDDVIRHVPFKTAFPDETPTKILRRGVVSCTPSECTLVLMLPDDVRTVD